MVISLEEIEQAHAHDVEQRAPEHLSYSRISLFNQCARSYQARYLMGLRGPQSEPLVMGTLTHAIIGAYYQSLITKPRLSKSEREQTSLAAAGDALVGIIDSTREDRNLAFDADINDVEDEAVRLGEAYIKQAPKHVKPVAVERKIEVSLGDDVPPLVGFVDVEAETSLVEIKTSSRAVNKPTGAWLLQGLLYQSAVPKTVEWHVITKTKEPRVIASSALSLPYDEHNVRAALELARATALRIIDLTKRTQPGQLWPATGITHPWACSLCDVRASCQLGSLA